MNQLKEEFGLAYLYITHDLAVTRYFGDRIMIMYGGKVMEVAESKELIKNPRHPYTRLLLAATPSSQQDANLTDQFNERQTFPLKKRLSISNRCLSRRDAGARYKGQDEHFVACHHAS